MLERLCRELGVEINDEWLGTDGNLYKIKHTGFLQVYEEGQWWNDNTSYSSLLLGHLKPLWKPKEDDVYYMPSIYWSDINDKYWMTRWDGDSTDMYRLKNNLIFQTKEEAIEATNEILELWRGK